ncbi:PREDICTED: phylloplanin-like [Fragaria vesca subsp. vesca]|uniref:phylloplanin-like n=1 Tax=Fragaria vesca subsp. vesca TaxID=101020 RepID=UPI0002C368AC|nr:PREDICTED: phylloplanin-like [Fragaria vesca subsp. vesca]
MALSKRTMLFVCLLVAAVAVAVPIAQGQTIGGLIATLLGIIRVQGVVYCSVNGAASVGTNGAILTPPFSNATVQLRCGAGSGTVLETVQTNAKGEFSILLDISFYTLPQILSGCRVVVTTPLASCNAALPSTGCLTSTLTSLGNTVVPLLTTVNVGTGVFSVSA